MCALALHDPPTLSIQDDDSGYFASAQGDEWVRGIALNGQLRALAVRSTGVAQALKNAQDPGPVGAAALSRAASAALLMGATLKDRQQVGLQINGNGPLGELYAVADASGNVRATVAEPKAELAVPAQGAIRLATGLGIGRLQVIRKLEEDAPAYRGMVPMVYGEIALDLAEYYLQSEQIPTAIVLGEQMNPQGFLGAGGYLLQALPGADDAALETLEKAVKGLPPLGQLYSEGLDPEAILRRLLPDIEILERKPVRFAVPGGRPYFARMLMAMGSQELIRLKAELQEVETTCHFTGRHFVFDQEQLGALIYGAKQEEERLGICGRPAEEPSGQPERGGGDDPQA